MNKKIKIATLTLFIFIIIIFTGKSKSIDHKSIVDSAREQIAQQITDVNRIINSISTQTEIVLLKEYGSTSATYHKSVKPFTFLTESSVTLNIDYEVTLSVPTNKIRVYHDKSNIMITYLPSDIKITAVEITDESIERQRDLFAGNMSDDEIIALKKELIAKIKEEVINDKSILDNAEQSLKLHLLELANSLDVNVTIQSR